jgi:electron transfer flavoprotein alpha subunit
MKTKIFVYIETFKDAPIEASLALLNYANQIIKYRNRDEFSITALVFTQYQMTEDDKVFLYKHGADSIFNIVGKQFAQYSPSAQINALKNAVKIECPDIFLFSTTDKQ